MLAYLGYTKTAMISTCSHNHWSGTEFSVYLSNKDITFKNKPKNLETGDGCAGSQSSRSWSKVRLCVQLALNFCFVWLEIYWMIRKVIFAD